MPLRRTNDQLLKDYSKHLIDGIIKVDIDFQNNDFFIMLYEFYQYGTIQDIINKDSSHDDKKDFLEFLARELEGYIDEMYAQKKVMKYDR
jgi:hypothetical protein